MHANKLTSNHAALRKLLLELDILFKGEERLDNKREGEERAGMGG